LIVGEFTTASGKLFHTP